MELVILSLVVLLTSTVSGALGMGGGMILMGALALLVEPGAALLLHGAIQLVANGHRAWLLRRDVQLRIPALQLLSALPVLVLAGLVGLVVERQTLLLTLGALALLAAFLASPTRRSLPLPSAERPAGALSSGALLALSNVTAGVSGPLLDIFFVHSRLDRFGVVATKAACSSLGHVMKMAYVLALFPRDALSGISPELLLAALPCAVLGTALGKRVLTVLGDERFRHVTRAFLGVLGVFYVARGLWP